MKFLVQGIILGISIAAPVGPVGVICIRRTLAQGMKSGFVAGLGAATADAIYGSIAVFGISVVSTILLGYQAHLHFIGGVFLLYLGYTTFKAQPAKVNGNAGREGLIKVYLYMVFLTLTNPMTILSFVAIFAGFGVGSDKVNYISAFFLVIGVFLGSLLWWLFLSSLVNKVRQGLDAKLLKVVNKISGLIIAVFGIFSLCSI